MTKKNSNSLLGKILGISPKKIAEIEGEETLVKKEPEPEKQEVTVTPPSDSKSEVGGSAEEETPEEVVIPSFDEVVAGIREALADPALDRERAETVSSIRKTASDWSERAADRADSAATKSDEI